MISGDDDPSSKDSKVGKERMFFITGRDVPEEHLSIRFEKETCRWKYVGSEEDFLIRQEEERYHSSPVVKTVKALLSRNNGRWAGNQHGTSGMRFTSDRSTDRKVRIGSCKESQWA